MTFTYDLASADIPTQRIAQVRLELGDTSDGSGVRVSGASLTDEEIAVWLAAEDNHILRTVARACEMLARDWSRAATIALGPRKEELSDIAEAWAARAKELRDQYGSTSGGGSDLNAGVIGLDFAEHNEAWTA
jgi:hypothetical protein